MTDPELVRLHQAAVVGLIDACQKAGLVAGVGTRPRVTADNETEMVTSLHLYGDEVLTLVGIIEAHNHWAAFLAEDDT